MNYVKDKTVDAYDYVTGQAEEKKEEAEDKAEDMKEDAKEKS